MVEAVPERRALLESMVEAFERGENANAEALLARALDRGIAWDEVTNAAALGIAVRFRDASAGRDLPGSSPR